MDRGSPEQPVLQSMAWQITPYLCEQPEMKGRGRVGQGGAGQGGAVAETVLQA